VRTGGQSFDGKTAASGRASVVAVRDLTRSFGTFTAVDHITFSVRRGEIFGFLGANGAGKTTTIRMLCGILPPTSGGGTVAGCDIAREYERIKRHIGYMSQKFSLYEELTVRENIEFFGGMYGMNRRGIARRMEELLESLGLLEHAAELAGSLPVGFRQRTALSAALIHDPEIILLDEPTSGVDPVSRRSFWLLIRSLADRGKTVFVTTHYMEEAEYCDRVSIMKMGRILEIENPHKLKNRYGAESMQEVFLRAVNGE
jgi:ABC-2 type transport system ATP-binding protein